MLESTASLGEATYIIEGVPGLLAYTKTLETREALYMVGLGILSMVLAYVCSLLWMKTQEVKRLIIVHEIQKRRFAKTIKEREHYIQ